MPRDFSMALVKSLAVSSSHFTIRLCAEATLIVKANAKTALLKHID